MTVVDLRIEGGLDWHLFQPCRAVGIQRSNSYSKSPWIIASAARDPRRWSDRRICIHLRCQRQVDDEGKFWKRLLGGVSGGRHSEIAHWAAQDRSLHARQTTTRRFRDNINAKSSTIVSKTCPVTIVVDANNRYLYYVLLQAKAIRYGVTVGEEALARSAIARIGRKEEWPDWVPTPEIKHRLANTPDYVGPGPTIPWAHGHCIYTRATRTRCIGSMAQTSRNISAVPSRSGDL
jgi:hypothetical protein